MIEIGEKIRKLRKQKNLTQEQLSKRLWVTKAIISAYETGTRYPSLEVLIQIAHILNTTTDYLLGVDKKRLLDISDLSDNQIEILNKLIVEFKQEV